MFRIKGRRKIGKFDSSSLFFFSVSGTIVLGKGSSPEHYFVVRHVAKLLAEDKQKWQR